MKHLRWQAVIAVLGVVLAIGLLAGQGRERTVSVDTVPTEGGQYTEALIGSPRALNPLLAFANPVDRDLTRLIFSGLTSFDSFGRPAPDLANWYLSPDQLTYTFILKPNLSWHDGQPLTADDVAFTVTVMQDPAYPGPADRKQFWQAITATVEGPQTIAFTLPEPFAPFLDYTNFGVLPRHLLQEVSAATLPQAQFNLKPVGSGPFAFDRWLAEGGAVTGLRLRRFDGFYRQSPLLTTVEFRFYPDADTALTAYRAGTVLGLSRLGTDQLDALPNVKLYTALEPKYTLIFLNLRSEDTPFFQEKKVRQALLLGLNRSRMVADILRGQAVVANSPVLPGSWAYNLALPTAVYAPAQAASLLESAGWVLPPDALPGTPDYVRQKKGIALKFTLLTPNTPTHTALAAAAQATWAQLGVQIEIAPVEAAAMRGEYLEPRAYQAALVDFSLAGTPDPDPYPFWHETQAESGQNYSGLTDRVTSQYLEQARTTTDLASRSRLYQNFQSRFADQVPALLLYYPVYHYAIDAKVNGVLLGPLTEAADRFASLPFWYTETRQVVVEQTMPTP
ncbi:MAG: ABC transporter substrate-binding protein [Anaerolineales bacterium]